MLLTNLQTTGAAITTKAGDPAGNTIKRIDVKAALDFAGTAPNAPSGLSGVASITNQITLSWTDNSADETGFKIERKTGASGTYNQIATVLANVVAYNDSSPSECTTYYYRVLAYSSLNSPYSNEASATTLPAAPSGLSAVAASSSQINLIWTDNSSGETGFKIERKTGAGGTYSQIGTTGAGVTTYSSSGLTAETTYYYRVRAYNAAGDSSYSSEANAITPVVPISAPAPVAAPGGGGADASLPRLHLARLWNATCRSCGNSVIAFYLIPQPAKPLSNSIIEPARLLPIKLPQVKVCA